MAQVNNRNQLPVTASDAEFERPIGLSPLGTPIFDDVTFPAGNYLTLEGVEVSYRELRLISVRYVVQQAKNIVRTQISGRNGTVKEYNATGDYIIKGQANLSELTPTFPREQLQNFVEIVKVPQMVPIVSKILNTFFEIDDVVLSDFNVDPGNGSGNVFINFTLESDREFDLSQFIVNNQ